MTAFSTRKERLLTSLDFPPHYVDMQHVDDYGVQPLPMLPFGSLHRIGSFTRLIYRTCWKSSEDNTFIPMSFLVDSAIAVPLYLSTKARAILDSHKLIRTDSDDGQFVFIQADGNPPHKVYFEPTPPTFEPANIFGLRFITKVGLNVDGDNFEIVNIASVL